jgi:hypothetical protein
MTASRPILGPIQPPIQWVSATLSPVIKRPERDANHSRPSSAEVKYAWSYISTPSYTFMTWCLIKDKDNFTFLQYEPCTLYLLRGCSQKFPDWPPGTRTANGTALWHYEQFYRYFVSQSSEFCRYNPLCCFSASVYCCLFRYRLNPETYGYTLVFSEQLNQGE